jgi:hypothetical protein
MEDDEGMLWAEAKQNHFFDWKFDRHAVKKFDELMRWFFQELHRTLRPQTKIVKPATDDDLQRYECTGLQIHGIIHRMKQEVQ